MLNRDPAGGTQAARVMGLSCLPLSLGPDSFL